MIALKHIGLTRMVWLVAGIGITLAMLFAIADVRDNLQRASAMEKNAELVDLSAKLSSLVHELQKERGTSAVFLTSRGQTFGAEMRSQREDTEAKREVVNEALVAAGELGLSERLSQQLSALEQRFGEIATMRGQIDQLTITPDQQVQFYTETNRQVIGLVGEIAADVTDPAIAKDLLVYSAFLNGKDYAGLDRSNGASGFAVGGFDLATRQKLVALPAAQQSYFDYVLGLAAPEQREQLKAVLSSKLSQDIASMREVAFSGNPERIAQISAKRWFDTHTARLAEFKQLEDRMASAIVEAISEGVSAANWDVMIAAIGLLAGLAIAAVISFVFVRSIKQRIESVVKPLDQLAQGELDIKIPDLSKTELGVICTAMEVFKQNALERAQNAEKRQRVIVVLRDKLKAMASGDLERPIDEFFAKEFAPIRMDFNEAQGALRDVIHSVVDSATQINHSANEVDQAARDLSERTMLQAATLEETAAALTKTSKGIKASAEKAQETNAEVAKTRQVALDNGKIVDSAVNAMEQIQASFAEVEQITHMIQSIAFQTNILALNAGVEATRAGEAGKGFGVVATEVRALAQRSSESVTSIQELMAKSAQNIERGANEVGATGAALRDMIGMIDTVSRSVAELAEASSAQADGLNEVNQAVADLDLSTQQNAAMAEQSSAASNQLNGEVQNLNQKAAIFIKHKEMSEASAHSDTGGHPPELRMAS